jgi:hypothetical protein
MVQLNQTVAAPPVRTSFRHDEPRPDSGIAWPWIKHMQDTNVAVNKAPQMQEDAPTHANAQGTIGAVAFDGNFLYWCVKENTWLKFKPVAF